MPRATVRAAITSYLSSQNIALLSTVMPHPPKFTVDGTIFQGVTPGTGTGAVIYIHLAEQDEHRIELRGNAPGGKARPYVVSLICVMHSKKRTTQEAGADNDTFLDSLVAAIEANKNAGQPGVVFLWGEGSDLYGTDIKVTAEMPRPMKLGVSQVYSRVDVIALEII